MKIRLLKLTKYFKFEILKEELRKIGVNFITAGIVGVFINHFVGATFSTMFWASFSIVTMGVIFLAVGIFDLEDK